MHEHIQRGEIYLADLNPIAGSEQGGIRPVLIIQNDIGNYYSPTTIIAPLSSHVKGKHILPTHLILPQYIGLKVRSLVMLEQIRAIDKTRLREMMGVVPNDIMYEVDKRILISLSLSIRKN